jgi:hypothetical protein
MDHSDQLIEGELHRLKYALSSGNISFITHWLSRYENLLMENVSSSPIGRSSEGLQGRKYGVEFAEFWLSVSSSAIVSICKSLTDIHVGQKIDYEDEQSQAENTPIDVSLEILSRILLLCSNSILPRSKVLRRDIVDLIRGSEMQSGLVTLMSTAEQSTTALIFSLFSASMDHEARQKFFTQDVVLKAAGISAILIAGNFKTS